VRKTMDAHISFTTHRIDALICMISNVVFPRASTSLYIIHPLQAYMAY